MEKSIRLEDRDWQSHSSVEHLPSKREALSASPNTTKKILDDKTRRQIGKGMRGFRGFYCSSRIDAELFTSMRSIEKEDGEVAEKTGSLEHGDLEGPAGHSGGGYVHHQLCIVVLSLLLFL
jgi:hypothetical protein